MLNGSFHIVLDNQRFLTSNLDLQNYLIYFKHSFQSINNNAAYSVHNLI